MTALWKEYLDRCLTTAQSEAAVKRTLLESRFFPTEKELVEAVKGDADTHILHEWDLCVKSAARGDRAVLAELYCQGRAALHLVGGLYKLGIATEEQLTWIKKEFIAVWKSTLANTNALPTARTAQLASH